MACICVAQYGLHCYLLNKRRLWINRNSFCGLTSERKVKYTTEELENITTKV